MKIKEKITNMVNIFIADPKNAEKAYIKTTSRWSSTDIALFWRLASQNEKIRPTYETAAKFLDYLLDNEITSPDYIADDFKEWYKNSGYGTDIGLTTFCETHFTYNFCAEDIDTDEELYEKVNEANYLWYWYKVLRLAVQDTMYERDLFEEVVNCL